MTSYVIIVEQAGDGGFGAWAPDLPGVVALGDTYAEAVSEMRSATAMHLDGLRETHQPIPRRHVVGADTVAA